jgi:hypothetical protein
MLRVLGRNSNGRPRGFSRRLKTERSAALPAELERLWIFLAAARTSIGQRSAAIPAEFDPVRILKSAL